MGYRVELVIPELPLLVNQASRTHYSKKPRIRKRWGWLMRQALGRQAKPPEPLPRARILCWRHSSRRPDQDGLVGSFKLIIDILQPSSKRNPNGFGIIAGDHPDQVSVGYNWSYAGPKHGAVHIIVEEEGE